MKKTFQVGNLIFGEGVPKICVPVVAEKQEVIWKKAEEIAVLPADLVEWRVDFYEDVFEMEEVLRTLEGLKKRLGEKPLLFTFRTRGEGGNRAADPETYDLLLKSAARGGAELIDVEAYPKNGKTAEKIAGLQDAGAHVIASSHDFQRTPSIEEMTDRLRYMERLGADAVKLAVMPSGNQDVLNLLQATVTAEEKLSVPVVTMSMGSLGLVSRICGSLTGSAMIFAYVGESSAPGQIPLEQMAEILKAFC